MLGDTRLFTLAIFIHSFLLLLIFPRMEQIMSLISKSLVFLIPVGVRFIGVRGCVVYVLKKIKNLTIGVMF